MVSALTFLASQEDVKKLEENEALMREELHERLEEMVCEVNDAINDRPSPETQKANLELDEMYDHLNPARLR